MRKVKIEVEHYITWDSCWSYFRVVDDGEYIGSVVRKVLPSEPDSETKQQEIKFEKTAYLNGDGRIFFLENVLDPQSLDGFIDEQMNLIATDYEEGRWAEEADS